MAMIIVGTSPLRDTEVTQGERKRTTNVVANLNEAMGDGGEFK